MKRLLVLPWFVVTGCGGTTDAKSGSPPPYVVPTAPTAPTYQDTANYTSVELPPRVRAMALDDLYVYVIDEMEGIARVPKAGGEVTTVQPRNAESHPSSIAVDAAYVYWTKRATTSSKGAVLRCPKAGGVAETFDASEPPAAAASVAVDDTRVYWTAADGVIVAKDKTSGALSTIASNVFDSVQLDLDEQHVFFGPRFGGDTPIQRVAKVGGLPSTIATPVGLVKAFAVGDGLVAWSEEEPKYRWSVHASGASGETTTGAMGRLGGSLATRGGTVYYSIAHRPVAQPDASFTEIVSWTPGQTPHSLVIASVPGDLLDSAEAMGVDDDRVYWVDVTDTVTKSLLRSVVR